MLAFCAAKPLSLCFLSCSCVHHGELLRDLMQDEEVPTLMMMYGLPNSSNARDMATGFYAAHAAVDALLMMAGLQTRWRVKYPWQALQ